MSPPVVSGGRHPRRESPVTLRLHVQLDEADWKASSFVRNEEAVGSNPITSTAATPRDVASRGTVVRGLLSAG